MILRNTTRFDFVVPSRRGCHARMLLQCDSTWVNYDDVCTIKVRRYGEGGSSLFAGSSQDLVHGR